MDVNILSESSNKRLCHVKKYSEVHPALTTFDIILYIISIGNITHSDLVMFGLTCKTIHAMLFGERMKRTLLKHFSHRFGMLSSKWQIPFVKSELMALIEEHKNMELELPGIKQNGCVLMLYGIIDNSPEQKGLTDDVDVIIIKISERDIGLAESYIREFDDPDYLLEQVNVQIVRNFSVIVYYNTPSPSESNNYHVVTRVEGGGYARIRDHGTLEGQLKHALSRFKILGTKIHQDGFNTTKYKNITNGISSDETVGVGVTLTENDKIVYTEQIETFSTHPIAMEITKVQRTNYSCYEPIWYDMKICKIGTTVVDGSYVKHPYFKSLQLSATQ